MKPYVALPYIQGTPEWVDARKRLGITASEAGAACGVGKYGGPFDVYGWHCGLRPDLIPTEVIEFGTLYEEPVARYGAKKMGLKLHRVRHLLQSRLYPWLLCSLDRMDESGEIVEIKTTGEFAKDWGEAGTAEVPPDPYCQVQTQMAVTGTSRARIWVVFGGQHFKEYLVPRDDEKIELIAEITRERWDQIQRRTPPQIDGSEGASAYLAERFKVSNGATIEANEGVQEMAFEYLNVNEGLKLMEAKKAGIANLLKAALGEATAAVGGDVKVSWTPQAGSTYTVTKAPTRVLRVSHVEA